VAAGPSPAVEAALRAAAQLHGIDEALLRALVRVESGFDHRARSPAGAVGLAQLMPGTAQQLGVRDRTDVAQSADAGARHLRALVDRFGGDVRLALAAYNAGEAAVRRHGNRVPPYAETLAYVPAVLAQARAERLLIASAQRR
jgi:soluble lytic murein transglycosylase-like protein